MKLTVAAMQRADVWRIAAISAAGAGESVKHVSQVVSWMIRAGNVGTAYRDLTAMEAVLDESHLDWLIVRPVTMVNGPPTERSREVSRFHLNSIIRRSDVSSYLVSAIESEGSLGARKVLLGS